MTEREAFGLELRRARERKGLTLEDVCERTKVGISHFSGLERGDVSHWPSGIFRRAFIRSYAAAVGLDPEELVAAFGRIFPDPGDGQRTGARNTRASAEHERPAPGPQRPVTGSEPPILGASSDEAIELSSLRLVLDAPSTIERSVRAAAFARRIASGAIDILLPVAAAGAVALLVGREWFWITAAAVGLAGHLTFFGLTGSTPGGWLLALSRRKAPGLAAQPASRRRREPDAAAGGRRHVPRLPSGRPPNQQHRTRH